jgi:hypothetical protein
VQSFRQGRVVFRGGLLLCFCGLDLFHVWGHGFLQVRVGIDFLVFLRSCDRLAYVPRVVGGVLVLVLVLAEKAGPRFGRTPSEEVGLDGGGYGRC